MLLGCIADDFTGATDLANNLVRSGLRVVMTIGVPTSSITLDADAVVVALKSRTTPAADAVAQSLAAARWLREHGAQQLYFKVCSTFDSTAQGNIGPVAEALLAELGCDFATACPAFPENQRTVYKGHLFVGDVLLNESSMRDHPLTPMRDANLVRVLQAQCGGQVGLIEHGTVAAGAAAITARIATLQAQGVRLAIVDAIHNADLMALGRALAGAPLLVAGSGVAIGLAQNHGLAPNTQAAQLPKPQGACAIISGSCSAASNAQVAHFIQSGGAAFAVEPLRIAAGEDIAAHALAWYAAQDNMRPVLFHATAPAQTVAAVQAQLGVQRAGELVEQTLAAIARGVVQHGVRQLVVAGGETSGACVLALGVTEMRVGTQIDPGVPWCHAHSPAAGGSGIQLALKSGNFGTVDFFTKAFERHS